MPASTRSSVSQATLPRPASPVIDVGTANGEESVDYPDFAIRAARKVASGEADLGVLVCGTGIGMAIAANKVVGVRAANVTDPEFARLAREHNNANVVTVSRAFRAESQINEEIVDAFLATPFAAGRHAGRVARSRRGGAATAERKVHSARRLRARAGQGQAPHERAALRRKAVSMSLKYIPAQDPEVAAAIDAELARQRGTIELIASENFVSPAVLEAAGTVLTNKYAEGLPGKRYYGGCEKVDIVENLARDRAKAALRRRPRQRPAARRRAGQHGRLLRRAASRATPSSA